MLDRSLLDEIEIYCSNLRAEITYNKCLRRGKVEIAKKIKRKYNIEPKHDDTVDSFYFALLSVNKLDYDTRN